MPYPNEHSARVKDPDSFEKDSFRRKNIAPGIDIIIGKFQGGDSMIAQAYRFDKEKFTAEEAKTWLKEHKVEYISFEAAQESSQHSEWIPIFRTGTHTDSSGNTKTWTDQDLDTIIQKYNPAQHEAPVVIGHPKENAPAYGWVENLERKGSVLYAKFKNLVPEFVDWVKKGLYKKRSIALYPDSTLKHIGYLGAAPPAVKGLPDVQFNDKGGETTIEFEEVGLSDTKQRKEETNMSFWERFKKRLADAGISFSELFGSDNPPMLYTEADIKTRETAAISEALKKQETEFTEKVASLDEARKKKEAEIKAREDALKVQEGETKKKAIISFCEDLKQKGILTPAMEKLGMGLQNFLEKISTIETVIEFGEVDPSTGSGKQKQTSLEFMQEFLGKLPKAIEFKEVAGTDKDIGRKGSSGEKIEALISQKMRENKDLSYTQAFTEVQKENQALATEYAEELKGGK